jgi:hypothetical protein
VSGSPTNGSLPKGTAERRRRPGRHAFLAGILVAVLGHGVLLWLNPSMPTRPLSPRAAPVALEPAGRLIPVVEVADDVAPGALPRSQARPTGPLTAPEQATDRTSGGGSARDVATPGAADRLRYRSSPLWAPPVPIYESVEECRARELTERLAAGVADPGYGMAPPPAGAPLQPRAQAGIRITVGPKRLPAGQYVLPPPPPDSLADSLPGRPFTREPRGGWKLRRAPGCTDSIPPVTPGRIPR